MMSRLNSSGNFFIINLGFSWGQFVDHYTFLSILYHILALIRHEQLHVDRDVIPPRMHAARKQIDRSFGASALSISQSAEQVGMSEAYFHREFREWFGTSPSVYLKKLRIENARLLLLTGYYSVSEVAVC